MEYGSPCRGIVARNEADDYGSHLWTEIHEIQKIQIPEKAHKSGSRFFVFGFDNYGFLRVDAVPDCFVS